jgi:hypothetical protein
MSATAKGVVKDWKNALLNIPGVTGVGLSTHSPDPNIIVYVEKRNNTVLTAIPKTLNGIPVEVRTTGKIGLLSMLASPPRILTTRTGRARPVSGGMSCGCPQITAGTFACTVVDRGSGKKVGLSNNHVLLAANWGSQQGYSNNPVLQPGVYDGGRDPADRVGTTIRGTPISLTGENLCDSAIFDPLPNMLADDVLEIGIPKDMEPPIVGESCEKSGRTTGLNTSKLESTDFTVDVTGFGTARFADQLSFRPAFAQGGDSGSIVIDPTNGKVIGQVFAGSDEITIVSKAANIQSALNIQFGVGMTSPSTPSSSNLLVPILVLGVGAIALVGIAGMSGKGRKKKRSIW